MSTQALLALHDLAGPQSALVQQPAAGMQAAPHCLYVGVLQG